MKSIRITIIILSSIICYSCGPEIALNNIDPEFQEYVDIYFDEGRKRSIYSIGEVVPLEIQFVTQDELSSPTTLGVCLGFGGNRIRISRLNWGDLQENEKEALISHEIGHCLLSRSHTTDIIRDCNCQSIMQAGGGGSSCIRDLKSTVWRDYYYDELFNLTDPPISIRRTDFSDWSRTPLFQFQDSIPLNINLEENLDFEYKFSFRGEERIRIGNSDFFIDINQDPGKIDPESNKLLEVILSRDEIDIVYTSRLSNFNRNPLVLRFISHQGLIHILLDETIFHSFEANTIKLDNIELMMGEDMFELLEISSIQI